MFEISQGPVSRCIIVLLYGAPGAGKTHLASSFGRSIVVDLEDGSDFLNVKRIRPKGYGELLKVFKWFSDQKDFDTLVLDSLTAMERLTQTHTLTENAWKTLEDPGYGKGYTAANMHLQKVITGCEYLRNNGKNVVIVAHAKVKSVMDPSQDVYERMEFEVNKNMINILVGSADCCFYLRPQVRSVQNKDKDWKTVSNGSRELLLSDKGGAIGKNRLSHMPQVVEFPNEQDPQKLTHLYTKFWNTLTNIVTK